MTRARARFLGGKIEPGILCIAPRDARMRARFGVFNLLDRGSARLVLWRFFGGLSRVPISARRKVGT